MMAKTNVSIFLRSNRIINAVCQIRHNLSIKRSKEFFKEFFLHLPTLRIWISAKESWPPLKWMSAKLSIETNKGFFLFEERRGGDVKWKYSTQNILCCREINDIVIGNETRFPERRKRILEISGLCEWFTGEGIFSRERYRENNGPINVPNVRNLLLYSVSRGSVQPDDHLPAGGGRKRETK